MTWVCPTSSSETFLGRFPQTHWQEPSVVIPQFLSERSVEDPKTGAERLKGLLRQGRNRQTVYLMNTIAAVGKRHCGTRYTAERLSYSVRHMDELLSKCVEGSPSLFDHWLESGSCLLSVSWLITEEVLTTELNVRQKKWLPKWLPFISVMAKLFSGFFDFPPLKVF